MVDRPREEVMALVASYGPRVLDMAGTLESELHIHCPESPDEVNALVTALRHGVVHYLLMLSENGRLASADLPAQVHRLIAESGMDSEAAERAVHLWADIVHAIPAPGASRMAWRVVPGDLRHRALLPFVPVIIIGGAGAVASMLPWVLVLAESQGEHFLIPKSMSALGTHTILNLAGAGGAFLGGAVGWMIGTPMSLAAAVNQFTDSRHRVTAAAVAAALGSFFGLWLGYHHVADIGAFLGAFLGAGTGVFLSSVYTWDK
jgi:hypothetical protein